MNPNQLLNDVLSQENADCVWYTDGSKCTSSPSVGTACYSPDTDTIVTRSLDKRASIYIAERVALLDAV